MIAPFRRVLACAITAVGFTIGGSVQASAPNPPLAPQVKPIDVKGLQRALTGNRGRVVVLNLWATWCTPCVEEFPDLSRLQKADQSRGLELVTVSFDELKDVPAKVVPFLVKSRVSRGTFVNKAGSNLDDTWVKFLEPKLSVDEAFALPRTYIYDRGGKLVQELTGAQTYAGLQAIVAPLLKR